MDTELTPVESQPLQPIPDAQADTDDQVIALWLHGKAERTQEVYGADIGRFGNFVRQPLRQVKLRDIHVYADSLGHLAFATQARMLAAVKSLFAFAHQRIGYLRFDPAAPVKLLAIKNTLATRILPEEAVQRLLAVETKTRNHALLRLLYGAGLRVSEVCRLTWADVQAREDAGQVTVFGKGGKTRAIVLSTGTWAELVALRSETDETQPVFPSRKGGRPLTRVQVFRIIRAAAKQAGVSENVSPHWLRHAHASHALERGAPIHLVQATLGHSNVATTGKYLHARPTESSGRYLSV